MVPFVRFVVVNHNGGTLMRSSVEAILGVDWPRDRFEVVIVDNASTDGSLDLLPGNDHIDIRPLADNAGFGAANNAAFTDLDGVDHVALINPDAHVEPDFLAPLVQALTDDPQLGAVCPKILLGLPGLDGGADRRIQNTGSDITASGNGVDIGFGEPDGPEFDSTREVNAWCGAAVLLRGDYLADVGGFEPRFFLYYEDTDLALRGRRRGWSYRYVPTSVVWHLLGATTGSSSPDALRHQGANRLSMMVRNAPWPRVVVAWLRAIGGALVATVRRDPAAGTRWSGIRLAASALHWSLPSRRQTRRRPAGRHGATASRDGADKGRKDDERLT